MKTQPIPLEELGSVFEQAAYDDELPALYANFRCPPFAKGIEHGFFYTIEESKTRRDGLYFVQPLLRVTKPPYGRVKAFEPLSWDREPGKAVTACAHEAMARITVDSGVMHHILSSSHPDLILGEEMVLGHVRNDLNPVVLAMNINNINHFFIIIARHYREALGMQYRGVEGNVQRRK